MPESNYEIMDESDIRLRLRKLKQDYRVKVGEVYRAGYGNNNYYCCLRVDNSLVQMICIETERRSDPVYGSYVMHWPDTRMPIEKLKVRNGNITTVEATKVADTLEEFYKKKFNGEL